MYLFFIQFKFILISSIVYSQGFWGNSFPESKIEYSPREYVCYRTMDKIKMDGKLDDISWLRAHFTQSFVDIEGSLKPKPFYDTKVKMLWDDDYFYFGAMMEEPHVWAKLKQRDTVLFKDNDFEIFLDPDGDTQNYYELEVNALGTEWDLLLLKPYHDGKNVAVDSWDIPGLITKVHVDGTINDSRDRDEGWSVEIAIPWKAFAGNYRSNNFPKDGEQWKVNFSRVQWDVEIIDGEYVKTDSPEFNWVWSPQGLIYMHMPQYWGLVQFTGHPSGSKKVSFIKSEIDIIKWALRQVYIRQRNYFYNKNRYTASLKELNLLQRPVAGSPWPPEIILTPSGWEASLILNNNSVIIRKDGKTWTK